MLHAGRSARTVALAMTLTSAVACGSHTGNGASVLATAPVRATVASPKAPTATTTPAPVGTAKPGSPPTAPDVVAGSLAWRRCADRVECATLTVPKDYRDGAKGTIELNIKRRQAQQPSGRVGSLLVNPGGPGLPGTLMVDSAPGFFSPLLLDRFDIVAWDPRGTGASAPIVCRNNLDSLLAIDPTPDTPDERQALLDGAKSFAEDCQRSAGDVLPYVSTENSARDMEQIRKALGEEKISYFGGSYGSELGAYYATLFPTSVRAMVLDGAIDPRTGADGLARAQAVGIETALNAALTACAKSRKCPFFHDGDPFTAFDKLLAKLDATPLVVKDASGAPAIGQGIAYEAIISTLYRKDFWPDLTSALAMAERGDGSELLGLYESHVSYGGRAPHLFEAFLAITCLDDPGSTDPAAIDALNAEMKAKAPRLGALAATYDCVYWPYRADPFTVTGAGAGPIVVLGTTGDAFTPLATSKGMAEALEHGILVTVDADTHTGYNENDCATQTVDRYLTELVVPDPGVICKP